MPVRSLAETSFFDPEFVSPGCLVLGSLPWVLARCRSKWFPAWLFAEWRGHGRRGRDAWPAVVLTTLLLLRWSEQGMSRRAAVRRAGTDVVWRAAMGLALGTSSPSERTVRDFERFLLRRHGSTQMPRYLLLHEHIVRSSIEHGVVDAARVGWAVDSTPMWCYGAARDTVRLLGDGLRMLALAWARASRCSLASLAAEWQMPHLLAKSTKGAFAVDWKQADATTTVVAQLAADVVKATSLIRRDVESVRASFRRGLHRKCRHLLRVVTDDLETNEQGQLVIAERVASNRLVSVTDPEARHGRKSKSQCFNGFKIHLLGDVVSGLITSLAVTSGNVHDSVPAHRIIRRAKTLYAEIDQVLADTAYGGARLRHIVKHACNVELVAPPPPPSGKEHAVGKRDFAVNLEESTATCANGVTTTNVRLVWSSAHDVHVARLSWPKSACDACPLSTDCRGETKGGRRVELHPYERELQAARESWRKQDTRTLYRTRTQCERLINQVTRHGGRQARAFGLQNAQLQAHAIAAASNLHLLARALALPDAVAEYRAAA
jgi:hypothetical protein